MTNAASFSSLSEAAIQQSLISKSHHYLQANTASLGYATTFILLTGLQTQPQACTWGKQGALNAKKEEERSLTSHMTEHQHSPWGAWRKTNVLP